MMLLNIINDNTNLIIYFFFCYLFQTMLCCSGSTSIILNRQYYTLYTNSFQNMCYDALENWTVSLQDLRETILSVLNINWKCKDNDGTQE